MAVLLEFDVQLAYDLLLRSSFLLTVLVMAVLLEILTYNWCYRGFCRDHAAEYGRCTILPGTTVVPCAVEGECRVLDRVEQVILVSWK